MIVVVVSQICREKKGGEPDTLFLAFFLRTSGHYSCKHLDRVLFKDFR